MAVGGVEESISGERTRAPRTLTDREAKELKQNRTIRAVDILPANWSPPPGFPDPQAPVRGMHRDRFSFLLKPDGDGLRMLSILEGGL